MLLDLYGLVVRHAPTLGRGMLLRTPTCCQRGWQTGGTAELHVAHVVLTALYEAMKP